VSTLQPAHTENESKSKTKQRYWITFLLDELPYGATFHPGLLHLTVVPWFVTDLPYDEVVRMFNQEFQGLSKFEILIGVKVNFGPRKNVPVSLVRINDDLLQIHDRSLHWLDQIEARWAVKNPYVDDQYKPHIRRRQGIKIAEAESIKLNAIYLITANRQEDDIREVAAKVNLQ
jgi:hypothetical protein